MCINDVCVPLSLPVSLPQWPLTVLQCKKNSQHTTKRELKIKWNWMPSSSPVSCFIFLR